MDLNQEHTSGPNEIADPEASPSGANNRLLAAALGGAVGILASRLLGVPPRVGVTIGSLVGANAEKIGPHLFRGNKTLDRKGIEIALKAEADASGLIKSTATAGATATAAAKKELLLELAAGGRSSGLPQSLQDVLDEYLMLEEEDDDESSLSSTDETEKTPSAELPPAKVATPEKIEEPLQLHKEAEAKQQPSPAKVEDLPIAPPLEDAKVVQEKPPLDQPATAKPAVPSIETKKIEPAVKPKVILGQAPPSFPSKPKEVAKEVPKEEVPKEEAPKELEEKGEASPEVKGRPVAPPEAKGSAAESTPPRLEIQPASLSAPAPEEPNSAFAPEVKLSAKPDTDIASADPSSVKKSEPTIGGADAGDSLASGAVSSKPALGKANPFFSAPAGPVASVATAASSVKSAPETQAEAKETGDTATVVESLWSRPPSTTLSDGRTAENENDDDAVLSAPGVPESDASTGASKLAIDRSSSPPVVDRKMAPTEEPEKESDDGEVVEPAKLESTVEPPKAPTFDASSIPVAPASTVFKEESSPPVKPAASPAAQSMMPGGLAKSAPISAAAAPPSSKADTEKAPEASKLAAGEDSVAKPPLFRPATKAPGTPAPVKLGLNKLPLTPPVASKPPPRAQATPTAPALAVTPTAAKPSSPATDPAKGNPPALSPAKKQEKVPAAFAAMAKLSESGAPGVAKPALFAAIPPVAAGEVSTAKTLSPPSQSATPPASAPPTPEQNPAAAAVSLSAPQTIDPNGAAAMSRLFKSAGNSPVAKQEAAAPAETATPPQTGNAFKAATVPVVPRDAQALPPAESPPASKPVPTQGPNPFMTSPKPVLSAGKASPPPLVGAPAGGEPVKPPAIPEAAPGKAAFNPFAAPKTTAEEPGTPESKAASPEKVEKPVDAPFQALTSTPVSQPASPQVEADSSAPAISSEKLKPKWRKGESTPVKGTGVSPDASLVAASQQVTTKEAKGSIIESDGEKTPVPVAALSLEEGKKNKREKKAKKAKNPSKGGLGRKALILSFPIVAGGLAVAGYKVKPMIMSAIDRASSAMYVPEMTPSNDPLAVPSNVLPTNIDGAANEVSDSGLPETTAPPAAGVVPPFESFHEDPVDTVSIPADAVVQILPAGDIPGQGAPASSDSIQHEEMANGMVDPIVREFENAKSVVNSLLLSSSTEEAAHWVHDSAASEEVMKLYYGSTGITPSEALAIELVNAGTVPGTDRNAYLLKVISADHPEGFPVSIEQTSDGYKVDWEAYIQCKDRLLEKFYTAQPSIPESFYVTLKRSHHFAPEGSGNASALNNKLCFKVSSPLPTDPSQYAYADSNSVVGREMEARIKWNKVYFPVVELEWVPSDGQHSGYMRISGFVRDTWRIPR
ncbi:MAG: hypothetical protein ACI9R3_001588 [Verrucomicrobiales bacterium]|jgi:hypothetical protein